MAFGNCDPCVKEKNINSNLDCA